jgi:hypothetical protein
MPDADNIIIPNKSGRLLLNRYSSFLIILLIISPLYLYSQNSDKTGGDTPDILKNDLIEKVPEYSSIIDWTAGIVRTEISIPITEDSPNIGKIINDYESQLRDELHQNLIKAMGYVRVSDLYLLKDYYSIKSDVRYEIISYADKAVYYPMIEKGKTVSGVAELSIFGKNGIASVFFRDLEKRELTNYIQPESESADIEYFDGLIIDTLSFGEFNPSIQMRIFDEDGILLYGPETVEGPYLEKYGICEYTTSLNQAFNSPRCGERVFYTIPFSLSGKMNTSFVLNNQDAARLFANPKTVKKINQSRVIVVKSP